DPDCIVPEVGVATRTTYLALDLAALPRLPQIQTLCATITQVAPAAGAVQLWVMRSEEHTCELQSRENLVCRLLLEKKKRTYEPELQIYIGFVHELRFDHFEPWYPCCGPDIIDDALDDD